MTLWADRTIHTLLGGISDLVGGGAPQAPPPPPPPRPAPYPGTTPDSPPYPGMPWPAPPGPRLPELTPDERAALQYMGIDPDNASIDQINKALVGTGHNPLPTSAAPGSPPPPGTPPPGGQPPPGTIPASTPADDGLHGATADAAKQVDAALDKNRNALNDADAHLADSILHATSSDQQGKAQLQALQQSIVDEVKKLGPTLDTPAGQQQLAEFLQGKTSDVLSVLKNAGLDSVSRGAVLDALAERYQAVKDGKDSKYSAGGSGPARRRMPRARPPGAHRHRLRRAVLGVRPTRGWAMIRCSTVAYRRISCSVVWGRWLDRRWVLLGRSRA